MTPAFRADIQIIRGGAIIFVFLYHLLPSRVPAGFLGVDIFFVLSGFLMCAIYDPSSHEKIRDFFFSRARRILPAYFTVLLFVVAVAAVVVLPHEFNEVVRHAIYSTFLIPNIGYWIDGSYFDKSAFRPALHFWSLGLEFEFYLIVPIVVWLHARRSGLLAAFALASFVACIAVVAVRPRYAFYLLPFRLWEFLLGFYAFKLTQLWTPNRSQQQFWQWLAVLLCIVIVVTMFVPMEEISHPKYRAAIVAVTTAAILAVGLPAAVVSSWAGRLMVMFGKYSYSIYLVHFPVITFWFYRPFVSSGAFVATSIDVLFVIVATAIGSMLLFHVVEAPMRKINSGRSLLVAHAGLIFLVLSAIVLAKPLQQRNWPKEIFQITAGWSDRGPERCGKFTMLVNVLRKSCELTTTVDPAARKYLLVGNSHADAIKEAMAGVATRNGADLWLFRENCVLGYDGCAVENVANFAVENHISTIILHTSPTHTLVNEVRRLLEIGLSRNFRVVLIDPVPVWGGSVLQGLYEEQRGFGKPDWLSQTIDDYRVANAVYLKEVEQIKEPNFARYSPAGLLCIPDCQVVSSAGQPYYFDAGHLTKTGALQLAPIFQEIFRAQ